MATIFKTRKGEIVTDHACDGEAVYTRDLGIDDVELCSFCGDREASAYWHGIPGTVGVCRGCAEHTLPLLMADALVGERGELPYTTNHVQAGLQRALTHFWRGVALAIARCVKVANEEARRK